MIFLYKIIFPNGKVYVGQTKDINARSNGHIKDCHKSACLVDKKILENNRCVEIEIIEAVENRQDANEREKFWIRELHSHVTEGGYNVDWGGWGLGKEMSEETKKKISESKTGSKNPQFGKPGPNLGKKMSEGSKQKMSATKKANQSEYSAEEREAIRQRHLGAVFTEERCKKISEALTGRAKHTEESKKRISEQTKGKRWFTDGNVDKFCKECPAGFVPGRSNKKVGRKCLET